MRYTRYLNSFFIITILVALSFLILTTDKTRAQAPGCDVTIGKVAFPADDTPFDFSTVGAGPAGFTLMDPSDASFMYSMGGGTEVTITEQVPEGWILDEIECTEPDDQIIITKSENSVTIQCRTGPESVTCNFVNRKMRAEIPTLSEWGLIAMAGVLGIIGLLAIRRRKVAA